jgi:hypothetical protein
MLHVWDHTKNKTVLKTESKKLAEEEFFKNQKIIGREKNRIRESNRRKKQRLVRNSVENDCADCATPDEIVSISTGVIPKSYPNFMPSLLIILDENENFVNENDIDDIKKYNKKIRTIAGKIIPVGNDSNIKHLILYQSNPLSIRYSKFSNLSYNEQHYQQHYK